MDDQKFPKNRDCSPNLNGLRNCIDLEKYREQKNSPYIIQDNKFFYETDKGKAYHIFDFYNLNKKENCFYLDPQFSYHLYSQLGLILEAKYKKNAIIIKRLTNKNKIKELKANVNNKDLNEISNSILQNGFKKANNQLRQYLSIDEIELILFIGNKKYNLRDQIVITYENQKEKNTRQMQDIEFQEAHQIILMQRLVGIL